MTELIGEGSQGRVLHAIKFNIEEDNIINKDQGNPNCAIKLLSVKEVLSDELYM